MLKFAVFASGQGSNLQAIVEAVQKGEVKAELGLVFSNKPDAPALKRAAAPGIKPLFLIPKSYASRQSFERDLLIHLKEEGIDFIVLAGYMLLLTPFFIKAYSKKILNVHPSLLPSFRGVEGMKDAFTYGVKVTGVTVHFVDEKMDHGPIILQEAVKIAENDTLETLTEKIHHTEHKLYPKAISLFVEGRLKIKGRKVQIV